MSFENYKYSNEGYIHTIMKQYFYKMIPKFNDIIKIEKETQDFTLNPDVYCELKTGEKIAIECQVSPKTSKELFLKTKIFTSQNIYTLWILCYYPTYFGNNGNYLNIEETKKNIIFHTKKLERDLHFKLYWRIYFIHFIGIDKILSERKIGLKVIYLTQKQTRTVFSWDSEWGETGSYEKYYKNRFLLFKDFNFNKINNLKLACYKKKGYKLTRFYDKKPNSK